MQSDLASIFPEKLRSQLRIYAWQPINPPLEYEGLIKIGQTTLADVNERIKQSQGQMHQAYKVHVDEVAETADGTTYRDTDVIRILKEKGFANPRIGSSTEWVRCTPSDIHQAILELKTGIKYSNKHHLDFQMRPEQAEAVQKTLAYYESIWAEPELPAPRFLWNAKMRFGKTFTAYQLVKAMGAKKVLIVTFKPAVQDAWKDDLETHIDFEGWQYFSAENATSLNLAETTQPLIYFGSFQDLLGKDKNTGTIKPKNEWIHTTSWDLVIFDEYHFGAWRDSAKELFEGEDEEQIKAELKLAFSKGLEVFEDERSGLNGTEKDFLPISAKAFLYLSGTPFRAIANGEFIEEQIYNWTYTDEQQAKKQFAAGNPKASNPYSSLPELRLFTYQMPDELLSIAQQGEFDEFDLNEFFVAEGSYENATFKHKDEVQKWLNLIRGQYMPTQLDSLKSGKKPPFPYADVRLLPYLEHSIWYLPNVASCYAMANLLNERQNSYWHRYQRLVVAGKQAGVGIAALPPVRNAIGNGVETSSITLTCGKLTTGVTVKQWSSILMLRNLKSPETYFQAAFRVQSPWSIKNPNGNDPNEEEIVKPVGFIFDFAPTRALRQVAEYGMGLNPTAKNPETAVADLVKFLPVLAYDGATMKQVDAGSILDIATAGTSATLLARKWESATLVNVDNATLNRVLENPEALAAVYRIEGFRALAVDAIKTVVNRSEALSGIRKKKAGKLTKKQATKLSEEEKRIRDLRKEIQTKLIKFATRIPAFMYLTDYRENTLQDVITKIEPELFKTVTGLSVGDFELLVSLGVFNSLQMNQAVFAFRRYEDASLEYTGIRAHKEQTRIGLYDTVITVKEA